MSVGNILPGVNLRGPKEHLPVAVLGWGRGALAPPLFVQAPQFFHRLVIIAMDDTMFATMCGVAVHHAGVYSCQH